MVWTWGLKMRERSFEHNNMAKNYLGIHKSKFPYTIVPVL